MLLDKEFKKPTKISDLQFDYIVVSEKAKLDLENILNAYEALFNRGGRDSDNFSISEEISDTISIHESH